MKRCVPLVVGLLLGLALAPSPASGAQRPVIAAASDLQFALPEVAARFEDETGHALRLSFGSSGNMRRQIAQGAPFELFLSADEAYVLALHAEGHTVDEGVLYAIGRIVLIAPRNDPAGIVDGGLDRLVERLGAASPGRFAIANPEHAPYGVAARQALESAGAWDAVSPRLVLGENVSQAARYALSGETAGGIVAYSLALAPVVEAQARHVLIPEALHAPLRQRMVLTRGAGDIARAFYAWLQGEVAREILARHGFEAPDPA